MPCAIDPAEARRIFNEHAEAFANTARAWARRRARIPPWSGAERRVRHCQSFRRYGRRFRRVRPGPPAPVQRTGRRPRKPTPRAMPRRPPDTRWPMRRRGDYVAGQRGRVEQGGGRAGRGRPVRRALAVLRDRRVLPALRARRRRWLCGCCGLDGAAGAAGSGGAAGAAGTAGSAAAVLAPPDRLARPARQALPDRPATGAAGSAGMTARQISLDTDEPPSDEPRRPGAPKGLIDVQRVALGLAYDGSTRLAEAARPEPDTLESRAGQLLRRAGHGAHHLRGSHRHRRARRHAGRAPGHGAGPAHGVLGARRERLPAAVDLVQWAGVPDDFHAVSRPVRAPTSICCGGACVPRCGPGALVLPAAGRGRHARGGRRPAGRARFLQLPFVAVPGQASGAPPASPGHRERGPFLFLRFGPTLSCIIWCATSWARCCCRSGQANGGMDGAAAVLATAKRGARPSRPDGLYHRRPSVPGRTGGNGGALLLSPGGLAAGCGLPFPFAREVPAMRRPSLIKPPWAPRPAAALALPAHAQAPW